jgi:hypothetical protein
VLVVTVVDLIMFVDDDAAVDDLIVIVDDDVAVVDDVEVFNIHHHNLYNYRVS